MKDKLAIVIAALMVTSMVAAISTTTVMAPTTFSLSSATVSPTTARTDTRIKFTVTVRNTSSDNIDNVIIKATSTFTQPVGYADDLVLAAENLENAVVYLEFAGENMKLAEDNKISAGSNIKAAGDNLFAIQLGWWSVENITASSGAADENAYDRVLSAATDIKLVADAIDNEVENLEYIKTYLDSAGLALKRASGVGGVSLPENIDNVNDAADENVNAAGTNLQTAATYLENGDLENASIYLDMAGDNLKGAGNVFTNTNLKNYFTNAGSQLIDAAAKLLDAGNFLDDAGYALGVAENFLTVAGSYLENVPGTILDAAGDNLKTAASLIEKAGIAMDNTNLLIAGDNLALAADNLANLALEIGVALGGDEMDAVATSVGYAADNLDNKGTMGITTAGDELISAAESLSDAASVMLTTAEDLAPDTWSITSGADYVRFDAIGDNIIAPGSSKSFVFLWTTPDIDEVTTYTISVLVSKEETTYTAYENIGGFSLTIDGEVPTVEIEVTQTGIAVPNLVGYLNNARAKITIVASEPLSELGDVYVEDSGTTENLLPPIAGTSFTTTDHITFTYQYITVENWDDNVVVVRLESAVDEAGNENDADMETEITVDTRAPVIENSGLAELVSGMLENITQAGTGDMFRYVDNDASKDVVVIAVDNAVGNADNAAWVTSVTFFNVAMVRDPTIDNRWTKSITLDEGYNSVVIVTATDRAGNSVSENIENIFIDTEAPDIAFNTITTKTGTANLTDGVLTNDDTPSIKLTVTDPGFPSSGLGVARENLLVLFDDNDNIWDGSPYGTYLENKAAWDPSDGVFENLVDNAGEGWEEGTYYINVWASDNIFHDGENGVEESVSFTIDVTAPTVPTILAAENPLALTSVSAPAVRISTSLLLSGSGAEVGVIVSVYLNDATTAAETAEVDDYGRWSVEITLTPGVTTKVEISMTDAAGNESSRVLYGYALADGTAPSVSISTPVTTGNTYSTDQASVEVSGTIGKDSWEAYNAGALSVTATSQIGSAVAGALTIGSGGSFTTSVALSEGTNTVTVSARDSAGNLDSASITIVRTVTPWATYAIIIVIVALILAAIAIFRRR